MGLIYGTIAGIMIVQATINASGWQAMQTLGSFSSGEFSVDACSNPANYGFANYYECLAVLERCQQLPLFPCVTFETVEKTYTNSICDGSEAYNFQCFGFGQGALTSCHVN